MAGGNYGRVLQTFWTDPDIKRVLTTEQKALLLYFFTSPHANLIRLYHCPLEYAAAEVGLPVEKVREWTAGALSKFVTYDDATEEVLVHRGAKHQVAEDLKPTDKRIFAVRKALAEAHSADLVSRFIQIYAHWPLEMDHPPPSSGGGTPSKGASKPLDSPSEANAVAVAVHSSSTADPPGVAQAREALTDPDPEQVDEVEELPADETSLAIVPGDLGERVIPIRPAGDEALPFGALDWEGRTSGSVVLREWINLQPTKPSQSDRDRFSRACRQLADEHTVGELAMAFIGMGCIWPWAPKPVGEGRTWTPEDLRRDFVKTIPAAMQHPQLKSARFQQEFEAAVAGGAW